MFSRLVLLAILSVLARPASGQVLPPLPTDISGLWNPIMHEDFVERVPGPDLGDYAGLPLTEAARLRADTWSASLLTLPEHQCKPHPSTYGFRGIGLLRISSVVDRASQELVKFNTHIQWMEQQREIWMDGRPHPPAFAPHTWQGFSTGRWEGRTLVVRTSHLKAGWYRRNGLPLSDEATMEDRFIRHGDVLTHVMMVVDPHYLSEPLVKTNGFRAAPGGQMQPYPCESVEEVDRPRGDIPHHLPGTNAALTEFAERFGLSTEAARGGSHTALPEFARKALSPTRLAR
jgi:hypothetical protein